MVEGFRTFYNRHSVNTILMQTFIKIYELCGRTLTFVIDGSSIHNKNIENL